MLRFFLLLALTSVAACAARQSNPVAISQLGDSELVCAELEKQRTQNLILAQKLAGADENVVTKNVVVGVTAAVLFLPAIFAMDLSNSEQIELRSLQDRDETLSRLQKQRAC